MEKSASSPSAKGDSMSATPILIGAAGGIFTGVFLGDFAMVLRPIGQIYVMLLEVAVFPYLISSLLHGLSSMTPATAWRLFKTGWPFYAFLWGVTLAGLWLLSLAIPHPLPLTLEAAAVGSFPAEINRFLNVLIPSDFFTALSSNYVPAVVLFCVFFGVSFQYVKEKAAMLSILDGVRQASFKFWSFVVRLVPIAVFALLADTAGTVRVQELGSLGLFLLLYFEGVLVLALWIIPGCIQALTPLKFSEVLGKLRPALGIALITTLPAAALPFVIEATKELAEKCGIDVPASNDVTRTNISVAYPFGQAGNLFVYLFIVFAAFVLGKSIPGFEADLLPVMTLLSSFGTPAASVNAVTFLAQLLDFPADVGGLYVELMTVFRYGQVVATVMGFAFLSFTVVLAYYGKLAIRWGRLAGVLVSGGLVVLAASWSIRAIGDHLREKAPDPYLSFSLDPALTHGVAVSFAPESENVPLGPHETSLDRIQRTGVIRIGYNPGVIPFCYRNTAGDLVGYDVAYAYQLARDRKVKLRFVPFHWDDLGAKLKEGAFDIAMSGIYLTNQRMFDVGVSNPYFRSSLAFFMPRARAGEFLTREKILNIPHLRIGIFKDCVLFPVLRQTFPTADIVTVGDYRTVPDFSKIDAAFWSLTQAEALAAAHPDLIAVAPNDIGNPLIFTYLTPDAGDVLRLLNYWLAEKKASGFKEAQANYWIKRLPRRDSTPRWSILRNVLGVGDSLVQPVSGK